MKNSTLQNSMMASLRKRQTFLPITGRCLTSVSTPRWPCSCMATTTRNSRALKNQWMAFSMSFCKLVSCLLLSVFLPGAVCCGCLSAHLEHGRRLVEPRQAPARGQHLLDVVARAVYEPLDRAFGAVRVVRDHRVQHLAVQRQGV